MIMIDLQLFTGGRGAVGVVKRIRSKNINFQFTSVAQTRLYGRSLWGRSSLVTSSGAMMASVINGEAYWNWLGELALLFGA